jgi:hypothetical protein
MNRDNLPVTAIVEALEVERQVEGYAYVIRLPTNSVLQEKISHLLTRPVGRPPNHVRVFHASFI